MRFIEMDKLKNAVWGIEQYVLVPFKMYRLDHTVVEDCDFSPLIVILVVSCWYLANDIEKCRVVITVRVDGTVNLKKRTLMKN